MEITTLEGLYQHPTNRLTLGEELQYLERIHGDSFCENLKIPKLIADLIDSKLYQHSNHTIQLESVHKQTANTYVTDIVVRQAGEVLGYITWNVYDFDKVRLHSKTIKKKLMRKGHLSSASAERLSKEYDTHFKPEEQISKAKDLVSSTIRAMKQEHSRQMSLQSPVKSFAMSLVPYLMQNIDNYKEIAISNGYDPDQLEELHTVWSNLTLVESVTGDRDINGSGFFVHVEGDTCLVLDGYKKKQGAHYSYALPEKIGRAVGMLKLTENRTFIRNVGYKYDPSTYFISGEYNE